jgi:EAL domain-containing protein (putative c-di-GMP-specific phosphodiesterase class I)
VRFVRTRREAVERLLWTRESRVVSRVTQHLPESRVIELANSGWCVIAPANELTDDLVRRISGDAACGLADVDSSGPPNERYLVALGNAIQTSGLGDRIGMGETPEIASRKILWLFFACREHHVEFQPIVDLATFEANEWECLFRLSPGMGSTSISDIVNAALQANRPLDLDTFVVDQVLNRIAKVIEPGPAGARMRFGVNLLPTSLLSPSFEAQALADLVRAAGLSPRQIIVECTEQQAVHDVPRLKKQVKALRRLGFGFAVDDAGAGYASFTVIAALEPSIIKIDREIVSGIGNKDAIAKKALVEAFVSFSSRIGAQVIAEGIENRRDLVALQEREVDYGQGYLLGRSSLTPVQPRRLSDIDELKLGIPTVGTWDGKVRPPVASGQ